MASKTEHTQEGGSTSWCCCGQTFNEHSAIHKHIARTHVSEIKQLTQATYEHLLSQLEDEPETQHQNEREVEPVDISAWIPDISHISEEELQRYWSNLDYSPILSRIQMSSVLSSDFWKINTDVSRWCSSSYVFQGSRQRSPVLLLLSSGGSTCHLCLAKSFM